MTEHLELDAFAGLLAGETGEPREGVLAHLETCVPCASFLVDLTNALPSVSAALSALPTPEEPADLGARLEAALAQARNSAAAPVAGGTDVVPLAGRRRVRWLPALAAVAAAAVLVTGGVLYSQRSSTTATTASKGVARYAVNDTGTDYTRAALATALPALLAGTSPRSATAVGAGPSGALAVPNAAPTGGVPGSAGQTLAGTADPLAALRTTRGLATCLASLTDPSQPGLPLALDYASFEGKPALVVVLPSDRPDKVDVLVVPPGCATADGNLLYFTRLSKP